MAEPTIVRPTMPARDTTRLEQRTRELAAYLEQWAYDERLFSTHVGGISVATHFRVSGREAVEIADEVAALLAQRDARETALRALVVKWRTGPYRHHQVVQNCAHELEDAVLGTGATPHDT